MTPDFVWKITPEEIGGHRTLRMPTTVGRASNTGLYDYWLYMDDFAMAGSEDALPKYPD